MPAAVLWARALAVGLTPLPRPGSGNRECVRKEKVWSNARGRRMQMEQNREKKRPAKRHSVIQQLLVQVE
jgi:hypothetical protein